MSSFASSSPLQASLFIITYGRSGSTLLQNLVNALPGHLLRGENAMLLAPLVQAWQDLRHSEQHQRMTRSSQTSGRPSGPHQPWFGYEAIDADQLGAGLAQLFTDSVLRPAADTRVAGFKEIRWHRDPALFLPMLEFLQRYFPQARFVFNTRDHDQVARSGWWKTMDRQLVEAELTSAEQLFAQGRAAFPARSLMMHYNDYIRDPALWAPLFDLLDLPMDRALVDSILGQKLTHLKGNPGLHPGAI